MKKIVFFISFLLASCESIDKQKHENIQEANVTPIPKNELSVHQHDTTSDSLLYETLHDTAMVELIKYDKDFILDIKYATNDNFTKQILYDCGRSFLRKKVAKDLINAHKEFKKLGYKIKIFDGYRPHSVQFKMWDLTPDKRYVGNPHKGSMHNRGCAVDLTLVDRDGKELDMGTPYDFFGEEAHITYQKLPKQVLENRKVLRQILEKNGYRTLETEWWHFSYNRNVYPILNIPIPCDEKIKNF